MGAYDDQSVESGFTGWNLMLDETGGPNVGPFLGICGGLITRDSRNGELTYSGQYKAFSHITGKTPGDFQK